MTPNLRSVVAQAWRSTIGSGRNFYSSAKGDFFTVLKEVVPSFKIFDPVAWMFVGFMSQGAVDVYLTKKAIDRAFADVVD